MNDIILRCVSCFFLLLLLLFVLPPLALVFFSSGLYFFLNGVLFPSWLLSSVLQGLSDTFLSYGLIWTILLDGSSSYIN